MYTDLAFYRENFHGDVLTEENAEKWLTRASDELDTLTFGRLAFAFPVNEYHVERVKKAVCSLAEVLCQVYLHRQAQLPQKSAEGSLRGPVASISSGRESISYGTGAAASAYAQAAQSEEAMQALIARTAARYLANVPDACGINLLYAGGGGHVP